MKILYVISDDITNNTSANIRNISLICGLLENGHAVQVACLNNNKKHDASLKRIIGSAKITYLNTIKKKQHSNKGKTIGNVSRRIKTYFNTVFKIKKGGSLVKEIGKRLKRIIVNAYSLVRIYDPYIYKAKCISIKVDMFDYPDVVISSSDPRSGHILGIRIKKALSFGGTYIQYWGDPMVSDVSASRIVKPFLRIAERGLLKQADLIVYTNMQVCENICKKYRIDQSKVTSIPTSNAIIISSAKIPMIKKDSKQNYSISIGYFGSYYKKTRNMAPLFEMIQLNKNIQLTIVGNTDWKTPNCPNIKVSGPLPADEVARLQEEIEILIVVENLPKRGTDNECYQVPGKAYHYGLTSKKVLIVMETGIIKKELGKYDRYLFCPNVEFKIAETIKRLALNSTPILRQPIKEFYPKNVANTLLKKLEGVKNN